MSWVNATKALVTPLIGAASLLTPSFAQAAIVVAASGPSAANYPVGTKLADSSKITLRAGDTITLLDAKGTRVLRNAGVHAVSQKGGPTRASTYSVLTRQRSAARVRTGAVRDPGTSGKVMSPNIWYVDVTQSGTRCIVDPASIRLWRAEAAKAVSFAITGTGSTNGRVSFESGSLIAPWDEAHAPVSNGASFMLNSAGTAKPISFAVLPALPANAEALATALIERGCTAQLELLTASLALPAR